MGDLNQHVTVHSRDELGQMADAVRSMIAYQHEMAEVARAMAIGELERFDIVFKGPPQRHLVSQRFAIGASGAMGILLQERTADRELSRAKDELVSMVSHELASPATSLVAYAGLLAENEYPEPERRDMLATMVQEGQRLTAIIQDFLDIQRLEHGRFQIATRPMDLRTLLEHAVRVASTDTEHPLTVDLPASLPFVQSDPRGVAALLGKPYQAEDLRRLVIDVGRPTTQRAA